jgi:hypothetical protein
MVLLDVLLRCVCGGCGRGLFVGRYCSPVADTPSPHYSYLREIDKLPMHARPEVFGLHSNANIVCEQNATFELFDTLLSLQVGGLLCVLCFGVPGPCVGGGSHPRVQE